eukprot:TRINITY_DN8914_c0_g1_i1.p1 TRINITY_DN8914_c0_g1~~TRINITY_DN8914_c0_g1_i1.p1  ORF type:complete len:499 (+),score=180.73 TRINITY_DN8914_c0_g1_i1:55-1551(+)
MTMAAQPAFWRGLLALVAVKLLAMYCYKSTDFEVHRNWMAITTSLPMEEWYRFNGSQWTLDYPPNFAYLEWGLGHLSKHFDGNMTELTNYDYASEATVIFMRSTVIAGDVLLYIAMCLMGSGPRAALWLALHPGLYIVDSVHFQYNSFLYALMVLSFAAVARRQYLAGAALFTVLVCFKHIYLYMAPAYFIFYLRKYVISSRAPFLALVRVGGVVLGTALACVYPFIPYYTDVLSRLFPWGRGLCHAYWAPNFYALYNTADIALRLALGVAPSESCVNTKGLVDTYVDGADTHAVLPSISPRLSLQITVSVVMILMLQYWGARLRRAGGAEHVELAWLCALSSAGFYSFSWHVHEKAILMVVMPLGAVVHGLPKSAAAVAHHITVAGTLSLFPLLFKPAELPLKMCVAAALFCTPIFAPPPPPREKDVAAPALRFGWVDAALLYATLAAAVYQSWHAALPWGDRYPFLPLMALSVTAGGSLSVSFARLRYVLFSTAEL